MKKGSHVITVTFTIEVEKIRLLGADSFGYGITTRVNGLTKSCRKLTKWKKDDVIWEVQRHIREDLT